MVAVKNKKLNGDDYNYKHYWLNLYSKYTGSIVNIRISIDIKQIFCILHVIVFAILD